MQTPPITAALNMSSARDLAQDAATAVSNSSDTSSTSTGTAAGNSALASQDVFLKLLVSQLKNQDPLNPVDGMSFVTQLAQFSSLDTLLGMRSDLDALVGQVKQVSSGGSNTNGSSGTPAAL